ncbi:MAG: NADH-quinone oxidoreductase subunit C [Candidatus Omnitrophica bacterium]|nr:NADH-quinone oxidoreductase subunit C [Candidatus Omnitrophota bacterium]
MTEEEKIKQELEGKFAYLKDKTVIKREKRIFADLPLDKFAEVFAYAAKNMGFDGLSAITGLDTVSGFAAIYHLNRKGGVMLNLKVSLEREHPRVNTVTAYFPCAENYEREIADLLGIEVAGLPAGRRYPLPDNWPKDQHPLRKDWKPAPDNKREAQNA